MSNPTVVIRKIEPRYLEIITGDNGTAETKTIHYKEIFLKIFNIKKPTVEDIGDFYKNALVEENALTVALSKFLDITPDNIQIALEDKPRQDEI
jgi:hypothetical protein